MTDHQVPDAELGLPQCPARWLAVTEVVELLGQRHHFGLSGVDHAVGGLDPLAAYGGQPRGLGQQGFPHRLGAQVGTRGRRQAVLEALGVEALYPTAALVGQGLVQPGPFAPLEHLGGGHPGLGQPALRQELTGQAGVVAVCLGPLLAAPGSLGLGRVGQVGPEAGRLHLFDHIAPAGAALHGDVDRAVPGPGEHLGGQPGSQPLPVGGPDPAPPPLARLGHHGVEGDLAPVQVQTA
jgi:hypothetical protein